MDDQNGNIAGWVVTKRAGVSNYYYGMFDNKDDAWQWINRKDPYRLKEWTVWAVEKKESYAY